ncbi:hypothetical protein DFQ30_000748 [Apophysomyces sp. BC1015]|nr:hypothetical protein DFQ30_000748 [Apophysomyces sp. BC1015]
MSKHGCQDLSHILNYAVLDTPIYASDFPKGKTVYTTMTQETIVVARDGEVITVNDIPVVRTDYLASNGVIHILDDGLIPGSLEFDSRKYLYGINATKMVFLLDKYGLGHYLEKNVDDFYTFLVPSNDALNEDMIPNIIKKDWLSYHIVDASWTPKHLEDGMLLPSEFRSVGLNGASQRIPVYIKARNWKDMDVKDDQSIRFGRSRVFNHIAQSKNIIYQISEPLTLPTDILTSLVLDLDMSTFVATLYVSGVMNEMRSAKGITVFAPTNDAFQQLGLVAKYLVHPTGKQHLQTVLRYHAVQALLYQKDMESSRVVANTLANVSMNIIGSNGKILVGEATVDHGNLMVSNGVIHKLDQVQIPSTVQITHHHLLTAIEANAMQELLRRANISELAEDHVLLAPTDRAFDRIDFEALLNDTEKMLRVAKLHILKTSSPDANEFPTLLSSDDMVIIRDAGYGLWTVQVKGLNTAHARVLGKGNVTKGFVLEIDTVLMPMQRGFFGLPLDVIEEFARMASPVLICLICFGGWIAYRLWRRRRTGYETIRDGEEAESNQ